MASSVVVKQRNVERLIASCEGLVSGRGQFQGKEWKLAKYVSALRDQITELERYPGSIDEDVMHMFQQKVSVLEEVVRSSPNTQPAAPLLDRSVADESFGNSTTTAGMQRTSTGGNPLLMRSFSQRDTRSRDELFSKTTDEEDSVRYRGSSAAVMSESSEVAMERHRKTQESIAEEMMSIARSLKETSLAAKDIITSDNQVLKRTNVLADQNIAGVETQTERVKEHSRGCPWGTIFLVVLVFSMFLGMVMFIRIVPKPRS